MKSRISLVNEQRFLNEIMMLDCTVIFGLISRALGAENLRYSWPIMMNCTSSLYQKILEGRGHIVQITCDDEECLKKYVETLHQVRSTSIGNLEVTRYILPYDVVILDYKMPKAIGVRMANNILSPNPRQNSIRVTRCSSCY